MVKGGLIPQIPSSSTIPSASYNTKIPILDVRSPTEFNQGHIPGAISVPLFSDDERAEVGTLFKKVSKKAAVSRGLEIVQTKGFESLLKEAPALRDGDDVLVYCFRGGMRSGSVAHLLKEANLKVHTLEGGYKAYRQWSMQTWSDISHPIAILGGQTGSGKTDTLIAMRGMGAQVLDLEGDANHRGSIFGHLGKDPQPTNEQYDNVLSLQYRNFSDNKTVFVEDESYHVGKCGVPRGLWTRMQSTDSQILRINVPLESRVSRLVEEYGGYDPKLIADCVRGLYKRLGHEKTNELCFMLEETTPPKLGEVAEFMLHNYYDSMYDHQMAKTNDRATTVQCPTGDALENGRLIIEASKAGGREV
jgi:tRNA 2-selenouridine synthase